MNIANLLVTQDEVRHPARIRTMIDFVNSGGIFDKESILQHRPDRRPKLMMVSVFPDGIKYLHDGHHRALAIYYSERKLLLPEEFFLVEWESYEKYKEINFDCGWVTPFDPRYEVRVGEFCSFKNKATSLPAKEATIFIRKNRHLYVRPRTVKTVAELAFLFEENCYNVSALKE